MKLQFPLNEITLLSEHTFFYKQETTLAAVNQKIAGKIQRATNGKCNMAEISKGRR